MIRKAILKDIDSLVELDVKIFGQEESFSAEDFLRTLSSSDSNYVVEDEKTGQLVGSLLSRIVDYKDPVHAYYKYENAEIFTITGLGVLPEWRGKGLASKLLNQLFCDFNGRIERIILYVKVSNTGAIKLYEKFGFHIAKTIEKFPYYQPIEDAHLMVFNEVRGLGPCRSRSL
jgi:ribosomal protein S18 acetylase RimI-like enzyme